VISLLGGNGESFGASDDKNANYEQNLNFKRQFYIPLQ
jgi:hypothetical protein